VLSVQNGVMKNEQVATTWWQMLGRCRRLLGTPLNGAVPAPRMRVFHWRAAARVSTMVQAFIRRPPRRASTEASPHIQSVVWSKYVRFVGLMGVAALTRLATPMCQRSRLGLCASPAEREVGDVATWMGIPSGIMACGSRRPWRAPREEAVARIRYSGEQMEKRGPRQKAPALAGSERGRLMEVEVAGYVVRRVRNWHAVIDGGTLQATAGIDRSLRWPRPEDRRATLPVAGGKQRPRASLPLLSRLRRSVTPTVAGIVGVILAQ
jgi:hypothetical protein